MDSLKNQNVVLLQLDNILAVIIALLVVGIIFLTEKETNKKLAGILFIAFDIVLMVSAIKKILKIRQNGE